MSIPRKRILLVEDDLSLREAIARVIENEEIYEVSQCENGLEAMEWMSKNKVPDMIITDYMMLVDGVSVVESARKLKIPVVMLTAAPELAHEAMKKKGIKVAIMSKPIDIWVVLDTVDLMTGTDLEKITAFNSAAA